MLFDGLDFLIYSSHKTGTQTLKTSLKRKYKVYMIHLLRDLSIIWRTDVTREHVVWSLEQYKRRYGRPLKIITVIRDHEERLVSSFFQTFHDDPIIDYKVDPMSTTVMTKTPEELVSIFKTHKESLPYFRESLDELREIDSSLYELYTLDFARIGDLEYINNTLGTKIDALIVENQTKDKAYKEKFDLFRNLLTQ